jgi:hypothetical protein
MIKNKTIIALVMISLVATSSVYAMLYYQEKERYRQMIGSQDGAKSPNFSYSESYYKLITMAEKGDIESINDLKGYYYNGGDADFRNLKYWSDKLHSLQIEGAYTNYILALSENGMCGDAWKYLQKSTSNPKDFEFYERQGDIETIDKQCSRKIKR